MLSPRKPLAQCYDEDLELIVLAEEFGFSEFWIGEHHTMKYENIVMPEIFIGKALGLTSTIRLGPAPVCLQYHHPVHVAGRAQLIAERPITVVAYDAQRVGSVQVCPGQIQRAPDAPDNDGDITDPIP